MALPKLFNRIFWHNNTSPDINEDNLNAMSKALSDIDDRLIEIIGDIAQDLPIIIEDLEEVREMVADAKTYAEDAEKWAVGTVNGNPVPSTDPAYHNNSKYWAENSGTTRISDAQWNQIENII